MASTIYSYTGMRSRSFCSQPTPVLDWSCLQAQIPASVELSCAMASQQRGMAHGKSVPGGCWLGHTFSAAAAAASSAAAIRSTGRSAGTAGRSGSSPATGGLSAGQLGT